MRATYNTPLGYFTDQGQLLYLRQKGKEIHEIILRSVKRRTHLVLDIFNIYMIGLQTKFKKPRGVDMTSLCPDVCVKDSETDPF